MRLFMNKSTSERAGAVGGVEKLKAIANRRMDISRLVHISVYFV